MEVILTVVIIFVTVGITAASLLGARKMISGMLSPLLAQQAETKRLLAVGIPCAARVLHIDQTGTSVAIMGEQSYELRFQLEVTPPAAAAYRGGMGPYRAEMVALVSMLVIPRVQPGAVITVRCDPQDPRKMTFESADPPGQGAGFSGAVGFPGAAGYPGAAGGYPAAGVMGGYGGQAQPPQGCGGQAQQPQGYGAPGQGYGQGGYGRPGGWNSH